MDYQSIFNELISLPRGETEWVEFKEAKNDFDFNKLGKYFSALSNEANLNNKKNGWLIFGVSDKDKKIVGTNYKNDEKALHKLKYDIANHTSNRITLIDIIILNINSKRVLMFKIPPAPKGNPTSWKGHYFGREGESLSALNMNECETIRNQRQNNDWSSFICPNSTIDDLDLDAISFARKKYKEKNPHLAEVIDTWSDLTFLNKAKITIDGEITNTAIILLGKAESAIKLRPAIAEISWVLKDNYNFMIDYEHFYPPFLLNSIKVYEKIRNLKYRHIPDGSIFPEELFKYDDYVMREALHNCIAHQDYSLCGKIVVVEKPDELIFTNVGNFFLQLPIEEVIILETSPEIYRNNFLAKAMVEVKMIDTIGSGIQRMFQNQRNRFFPLPEYDLTNPERVKVKIIGKVLDANYTKILMTQTKLSLQVIALLDKIQKKETISDEAIKLLRKLKLIEGRKPNFYISSKVAKVSNKKTEYIKNRAFNTTYYQKMILDYLKEFSSASREEIDKLLLDKISDALSEKQKKTKIKNILGKMSKKGLIHCSRRGSKTKWTLL